MDSPAERLSARGERPRDRVDHALAGAPVDLADHLARDTASLVGELSGMRERPLDPRVRPRRTTPRDRTPSEAASSR